MGLITDAVPTPTLCVLAPVEVKGLKSVFSPSKVQNITAGIPRMVAVVKHVPRANKELLQDWLMETSTREVGGAPVGGALTVIG